MRGREGGAVLQPKPVCVYRYVCVRDAPAPHVGWRALEKDGERCSEHEAAGGARGNFESWEGAAERKGEEVGLSLSTSLFLYPRLFSLAADVWPSGPSGRLAYLWRPYFRYMNCFASKVREMRLVPV